MFELYFSVCWNSSKRKGLEVGFSSNAYDSDLEQPLAPASLIYDWTLLLPRSGRLVSTDTSAIHRQQ
jgi:hypothetical protein